MLIFSHSQNNTGDIQKTLRTDSDLYYMEVPEQLIPQMSISEDSVVAAVELGRAAPSAGVIFMEAKAVMEKRTWI